MEENEYEEVESEMEEVSEVEDRTYFEEVEEYFQSKDEKMIWSSIPPSDGRRMQLPVTQLPLAKLPLAKLPLLTHHPKGAGANSALARLMSKPRKCAKDAMHTSAKITPFWRGPQGAPGPPGLLLVLTTVTAHSTDAAITGRGGSLSLNSPQHDQVDTASIPALLRQSNSLSLVSSSFNKTACQLFLLRLEKGEGAPTGMNGPAEEPAFSVRIVFITITLVPKNRDVSKAEAKLSTVKLIFTEGHGPDLDVQPLPTGGGAGGRSCVTVHEVELNVLNQLLNGSQTQGHVLHVNTVNTAAAAHTVLLHILAVLVPLQEEEEGPMSE
ncbi:hypothetical protein F7725_013392 [Dissostichus mawsoni]|uniref:Uncharacterized protein n=1 Tax=Dissostichus mawsoni TaxID=36200 RepID=A0A7J5YQD7_DISMA|nr:hypothetical protein F7725_013392 [Dissostichus mawsoni]